MWKLTKHRGKYAAVRTANGKRVRRSLSTADLDIAVERLRDFNRLQKQRQNKVRDVYFDYRDLKEGTSEYKKLLIMWKPLSKVFDSLRADQIDRFLCRDYIKFRQNSGISNNTIIRELGALKAAIRSFDKRLPVSFELPPKPPPKDRYLTRTEYKRLLDASTAPHMSLFIRLALATGSRSGALLELKWNNVDFDKRQINLGVGAHNKRRAIVPINDEALAALQEAYNARLSEYVIEYGGKQIKWIIKGFKATAKRAELDGVTPHVLRHTAAVWMAEAGVSMAEIAQYLGHTSMTITYQVYARFSPNHLRKASDVLQLGTYVPLFDN